jgi:hypothetical protein
MEVNNYNDICNECYVESVSTEPSDCPGCGEDILVGAHGYCADCWTDRFGSDAYADERPHWCGKEDCEQCQSEYYEQCGGCGTNCNLWNDRYCKGCYDDRHLPKCVNGCGLPAPGSKMCYACIDGPAPIRSAAYTEPEPDYRCPEDVRDDIEMITQKLQGTKMTPRQQADWRWLLGNRQEELARMEAEMWEGFDKDDLRKMDQNMRIL